MNIRYLEPARREVLEATAYYERQNALGEQLLAELDHVVSILREAPLVGAAIQNDVRRLLLRRFPYSVIYVLEDEDVLIIAFAHQRRMPGYWVDRL